MIITTSTATAICIAAPLLVGLLTTVLSRQAAKKAVQEDRAIWRANIAQGLTEASRAVAQTSEAAAAALKLVAEAVQGTGEMGFLESSVLAERVAEGARLDAKAHQAPSLVRATVALQEMATARELIRVMDTAEPMILSLQADAIHHLDEAAAAYLGTTTTTD